MHLKKKLYKQTFYVIFTTTNNKTSLFNLNILLSISIITSLYSVFPICIVFTLSFIFLVRLIISYKYYNYNFGSLNLSTLSNRCCRTWWSRSVRRRRASGVCRFLKWGHRVKPTCSRSFRPVRERRRLGREKLVFQIVVKCEDLNVVFIFYVKTC